MAQYISKSALAAEIENIKSIEFNEGTPSDNYACMALDMVIETLDTLEGKEVDLEKYYHDFLQKEWFDKNCCRTISEMMAFTAKHFFELGMRFSAIGSDYIEGVRGYYETTTK